MEYSFSQNNDSIEGLVKDALATALPILLKSAYSATVIELVTIIIFEYLKQGNFEK